MASATKMVRCAIYTRKSSEEGLEQDFNSLDAQREACEAYIKSQKHEGWEALPTQYDDGGFSGGTLERPALVDLLTHIKQKKIDVVVVYKIDRLTRSLFDFSKIVEIFDDGGVSFVSVTQQFNTTTSMGRLTLNVLLSFAQFEREVTGERIRDKIAASKKKGMWMGGCIPLGYRVEKRALVIDEDEAAVVRQLYALYPQLLSVNALRDEAARLGFRTRRSKLDILSALSRGHIYRVLTNPIYTGQISHKGRLSQGLHDPIIDLQTWEYVQKLLADSAGRERDQPNAAVPSPLAGIIFDPKSQRLTPTHAVKGGKRYRYYVSQFLITDKARPDGIRLSAPEVEGFLASSLRDLLNDPVQIEQVLGRHAPSPSEMQNLIVRSKELAANLRSKPVPDQLLTIKSAIIRLTIGISELTIDIRPSALGKLLFNTGEEASTGTVTVNDAPDHRIILPMRLGRRGSETRLIVQSGTQQRAVDHKLLKLIARGFAWREELMSGKAESALSIGQREGISRPYVSRLIDLSFLAPDIVVAIANGTAPADLSSERLQCIGALPLDWPSQRAVLGFGR